VTVGVVNLMGRVFMPPVDDPFRVGRDQVDELRSVTKVIVVDVHAEATSEKMALGRFLDGSVSLVYGRIRTSRPPTSRYSRAARPI